MSQHTEIHDRDDDYPLAPEMMWVDANDPQREAEPAHHPVLLACQPQFAQLAQAHVHPPPEEALHLLLGEPALLSQSRHEADKGPL